MHWLGWHVFSHSDDFENQEVPNQEEVLNPEEVPQMKYRTDVGIIFLSAKRATMISILSFIGWFHFGGISMLSPNWNYELEQMGIFFWKFEVPRAPAQCNFSWGMFNLKESHWEPPPPPPQKKSLLLRDLFFKNPLQEKHHAFWYHTDKRKKLKN